MPAISADRFQRFVLVVDCAGEVCQRVSGVQAAEWCSKEQARRLSRDRIKLTGWTEFHECRTRTGRSYTYQEPTHVAVDQRKFGPVPITPSGRSVLAHKTIAAEDRGYFVMAVTDNLVFK